MLDVTPVNARMWARLGQRGAIFGVALPELAKDREDIRVLTADLALLSGLERFKTAHSEQFLNVGIAEQNMIGIAAGLAMEGNCVFATTYASFVSMRSCEQVRHNLGYMGQNVKIVGSSAGLVMGMSGNTHYAIEDIAIMRAIPNMTVISPADSVEAVKATRAIIQMNEPVYLRLTGELTCPMVYKNDYEFSIGKGIEIRSGTKVAIIAIGTMVSEAIKAADILATEGSSASVVNMHTIKPLDKELLRRLFSDHELVVTIEEHSIIGGLGSAVAEYKAGFAGAPRQIILGVPDTFERADEYKALLDKYGLTAAKIAERIKCELR